MLSKAIVIEKPHFSYPSYQHVRTNTSPVQTQKQLDDFLLQQPVAGTYMRFRSGIGDDIYNRAQLAYVLYVEPDITRVKVGYNGWLETHLCVQCNYDSGHDWVRWVDPRDYTPVTQQTLDKWNDDKLQDYLARIKATNQTYLEATTKG